MLLIFSIKFIEIVQGFLSINAHHTTLCDKTIMTKKKSLLVIISLCFFSSTFCSKPFHLSFHLFSQFILYFNVKDTATSANREQSSSSVCIWIQKHLRRNIKIENFIWIDFVDGWTFDFLHSTCNRNVSSILLSNALMLPILYKSRVKS